MGNYISNQNVSDISNNVDMIKYNHVQGPIINSYISRLIQNAIKYKKWFQYEKQNNNLENIRQKYQIQLDNLLILKDSPQVLNNNKKLAKYYNKLNYDKYIEYVRELGKLEMLTRNKFFKDTYNLEYKNIINNIDYLINNYLVVNSFLQKQEQYYQNNSFTRVNRRIIKLNYLISLIDNIL